MVSSVRELRIAPSVSQAKNWTVGYVHRGTDWISEGLTRADS